MYKVRNASTSLNYSGQDKIPNKYPSKDLDQAASLDIDQSKARSIMSIQSKIQVKQLAWA